MRKRIGCLVLSIMMVLSISANIGKEIYVQATAKERSREQVLENNVITVSKITGTNPMYYKVTVTKPSTLEFQFFGYQGLSGTIALCNKIKR